jgi:hypothetical protein
MSKVLSAAAFLLFFSMVGLAQRADEVGFIFLPFKNSSDFQGKWQLHTDVPRFMSAYASVRFGVRTVSPIVVLNYLQERNIDDAQAGDIRLWKGLYEKFGLRFIVSGEILDFDVSRFITGDPQIAGYEAFKGEVRTSYRVFDLKRMGVDALEVGQGEASGEFSDRSLVLTLFGKPTQRTVEYRDLDKIPFGSEDFNRTVIGQACLQMCEHFSLGIEVQLPMLRSKSAGTLDTAKVLSQFKDTSGIVLTSLGVEGLVVFVESDDVFINLGKADGVQKGMTATVISQKDPNKKVCEIEVVDVRSDHFSLARISGEKREIRVKDRVIFKMIR